MPSALVAEIQPTNMQDGQEEVNLQDYNDYTSAENTGLIKLGSLENASMFRTNNLNESQVVPILDAKDQ